MRLSGWARRHPGRAASAAASALVVLLLASTLAYGVHALQSLPAPGRGDQLSRSITVYDRQGRLIAERNTGGLLHVPVRLADMGRMAPQAVLAAEDRDFYHHGAVSPIALLRAGIVDVFTGTPAEGGSTLTQQLVKIEFLRPEKSVGRKLQEAYLAYALEHRYSKDQILEMYLNRVYFGHGAYGLGAAARVYFGPEKQVRDLTAAQAALLAGLIQAPSAYDPAVHFDRARDREQYVLHGMVVQGVLSQADADRAAREDVRGQLRLGTGRTTNRAPHFVDHVLADLEHRLGPATLQRGGLAVHTTLDLDLQGAAEQSVAQGVATLASKGVNNGDLVAARADTGEILAWVGSADYGSDSIGGQFDVATAPRQPGSSFKPYVYAAALRDHRITLATTLSDSPTDFGGYRPLDFDNRFMGPVCARQALLLSRNVPAVQVGQREGMGNVTGLARDMGISSQLKPELQTAIGGSAVSMLENLQGYQVLANGGRRVPLVAISSVVDGSGHSVDDLQPGRRGAPVQVLDPAVAYLVTDVLRHYPAQWGLGWSRDLAGKSGTSGGSRVGFNDDAWMMAYNSRVVIGAWSGRTAADPSVHGTVTAYGVDTGRALLAGFINALPAALEGWAPPPRGLTNRGGELFLTGTENQDRGGCRGATPPPGNGHGNDKKDSEDGGGD